MKKVKAIGLIGGAPRTVRILRDAKDILIVDHVFFINEKYIPESQYVKMKDLEELIRKKEIEFDQDWNFRDVKIAICDFYLKSTHELFVDKQRADYSLHLNFYHRGMIYEPYTGKVITLHYQSSREN